MGDAKTPTKTTPPSSLRLHLDASLAAGATASLSRDQAHYLLNVMRRAEGDPVRAFNGRDGEFAARLRIATKRDAALELGARLRPPETPPDLWLLFAPIKKARTDFIVEKATELGARVIQPVITRRTNAERVKLDRLRAHAIKAAEQCERVVTPELRPPTALSALLEAWTADRRLFFCDEMRDAPPLAEAAAATMAADGAAILIGPEGGFAPEEAADLKARSFVRPVSLGPRILRADTAAAAALAVWQSVSGDWRAATEGAS